MKASIATLLLFAAVAFGQEDMTGDLQNHNHASPSANDPGAGQRWLLAPKIGFFKATGTGLGGAAYAGLEVGYLTPWLDDHLELSVEGDFFRPADSGAVSSPQLTVNGQTASGAFYLQQRELGLLLDAIYRFSPIGGFLPYAGLGPAVYQQRAKISAFGTTNTATETKIGAQLLAGAEYGIGPGAAFLEVHYHFTRVNFLATGSASVGGILAAAVGYRLAF